MLKLTDCRMRNSAKIKELSEIQPDFIGFIFHEKSSRNVSETVLMDTPKNINRVGVFVNESNTDNIYNFDVSFYGISVN